MSENHPPPASRPDPAGLPLFTDAPTAPPRPGRVRSQFSMRPGTPAPPAASGTRPAFGTGDIARPGDATRPGLVRDGIDWSLVAMLRAQASDRLSAALGQDRRQMSQQTQRELGRSIILELLEAEAEESVSAGRNPWPLPEQERMSRAVFDALFGLGRLQPLVDDEAVENIEIDGCDNVLLEYADGLLKPGPAVAESDRELTDFLVFVASRSEVNARPFSQAQPRLHLRLDGGARLAATAWVTPRPAVVIRRHRLRTVTLAELEANGTMTGLQASFLRAAVKAKKSIVVAGPQGAGKTTTVRALCCELDPWERIGTFETEYELGLHELRDPHTGERRHHRVVAWEARPGSGEVGPNGRQAGEITLDDLLTDSFRFNLSRQIVGEVRGREVLAMIRAMQSGAGSISTTHSADATGAIRKLITCAMEAGPQVTETYATRAITEHIDLIVQVDLQTTPLGGGDARRDRWLSEIVSIEPGERQTGYATQHVFRPVPGGPGVANVLPEQLKDLERFGFDTHAFEVECQMNGARR